LYQGKRILNRVKCRPSAKPPEVYYENQSPVTLIEHFSTITDPRIDRTKRHKLIDILVISVCATICGAESWEDFELFGRCKLDWFKSLIGRSLTSSIRLLTAEMRQSMEITGE